MRYMLRAVKSNIGIEKQSLKSHVPIDYNIDEGKLISKSTEHRKI